MTRLARRFRNLRIKNKLYAVVLLTSTVALLLAVLTFLIYEVSTSRGERVQTLTTLADLLAVNSAGALSFSDPDHATRVLSVLDAEPNVIGAMLYDEEGIEIANFRRAGFQEKLSFPARATEVLEARFNNGQLALSRPVILANRRIGLVHIVSDSQLMQSRLWGYGLISAAIFAASLLAATLLSSGLQRLISVPIERLATTAAQVGESKDFTVRAEKMGEDELGLLTDTFNQMLDTIERRRLALQQAHDSLERRVQTRTQQLQAANDGLERSEGALRLAVEGAKIGVWGWDITTGELNWSKQCRAIFGLTPDEEISYERFLEVLHPDDRDPTDAAVKEALETKGDFKVDYRAIWEDKSVHWIEAMGRGFYDDDGVAIRMQGVVMDITPRKLDETRLKDFAEELQRSNSELDRFAYVASHDLKSPLRAIQNLAKWIDEDAGDALPEESRNDLAKMRERVTRMEALLDSLLQYSRIGRKEDKPEAIDSGQLVEDLVATLDVPEKFTVEVVGEMPTLKASRGALNRVLGNLIANAIKHHEGEEGLIRVSCRDLGRFHEFAVADNGPGIPKEFHDRVFVMFQTLKPRDEVEGTGMGLALVKKTVELHGGRVTIESKDGAGTTFRFTWPKIF